MPGFGPDDHGASQGAYRMFELPPASTDFTACDNGCGYCGRCEYVSTKCSATMILSTVPCPHGVYPARMDIVDGYFNHHN